MGFEHTWRWFGPKDPISLKEIRQIGITGIVTALHHIPVGELWTIDEIQERINIIESEGLNWSVVESLPVHENIKKGSDNSPNLIENYRQSIRHLAECGIKTICYNFMPVLDWSRTNLKAETKDGAITTKFESKVFAAFDLFILKRPGAEEDYSSEIIDEAKVLFNNMTDDEKNELTHTILYGLPGSMDTLSFDDLKKAVIEYNSIGEAKVRESLYHFIKEIMPVAEKSNVQMAIHPDDPPWTLLGLPRVAGTKQDMEKILDAFDSPSNGITFCTGSLGAGYHNDLLDMVKSFAHRINFIHLRSVERDKDGNFIESYHLGGDVDLYSIMKELLIEQKRREALGRIDFKIPMRPDHGHLMLSEIGKDGIYPGYSLLGRMRGLAELRGLELGIIRALGL
jgi:mannonate dehydratase